MFSFKKRQLDEVIQKARENERKIVEREYLARMKTLETHLTGKHKLELAAMQSEIDSLNHQLSMNRKEMIETDKKSNEADEKYRQARMILLACNETAETTIKGVAGLVKPFLSHKYKAIELQKELMDAEKHIEGVKE